MKKLIATLGLVLSVAAATADDGYNYLYWMVDISGMDGKEQCAFAYATVGDGKNAFAIYDADGETRFVANSIDENGNGDLGYVAGYSDAGAYADISGYLGSTFMFELFNDDDEKVGYSTVSRSALNKFMGNTTSQISSPYVLTSVVIPEPTSGLLLLIGLAGLGLRRKRA